MDFSRSASLLSKGQRKNAVIVYAYPIVPRNSQAQRDSDNEWIEFNYLCIRLHGNPMYAEQQERPVQILVGILKSKKTWTKDVRT